MAMLRTVLLIATLFAVVGADDTLPGKEADAADAKSQGDALRGAVRKAVTSFLRVIKGDADSSQLKTAVKASTAIAMFGCGDDVSTIGDELKKFTFQFIPDEHFQGDKDANATEKYDEYKQLLNEKLSHNAQEFVDELVVAADEGIFKGVYDDTVDDSNDNGLVGQAIEGFEEVMQDVKNAAKKLVDKSHLTETVHSLWVHHSLSFRGDEQKDKDVLHPEPTVWNNASKRDALVKNTPSAFDKLCDKLTIAPQIPLMHESATTMGNSFVTWAIKPCDKVVYKNAKETKAVRAHLTERVIKLVSARIRNWGPALVGSVSQFVQDAPEAPDTSALASACDLQDWPVHNMVMGLPKRLKYMLGKGSVLESVFALKKKASDKSHVVLRVVNSAQCPPSMIKQGSCPIPKPKIDVHNVSGAGDLQFLRGADRVGTLIFDAVLAQSRNLFSELSQSAVEVAMLYTNYYMGHVIRNNPLYEHIFIEEGKSTKSYQLLGACAMMGEEYCVRTVSEFKEDFSMFFGSRKNPQTYNDDLKLDMSEFIQWHEGKEESPVESYITALTERLAKHADELIKVYKAVMKLEQLRAKTDGDDDPFSSCWSQYTKTSMTTKAASFLQLAAASHPAVAGALRQPHVSAFTQLLTGLDEDEVANIAGLQTASDDDNDIRAQAAAKSVQAVAEVYQHSPERAKEAVLKVPAMQLLLKSIHNDSAFAADVKDNLPMTFNGKLQALLSLAGLRTNKTKGNSTIASSTNKTQPRVEWNKDAQENKDAQVLAMLLKQLMSTLNVAKGTAAELYETGTFDYLRSKLKGNPQLAKKVMSMACKTYSEAEIRTARQVGFSEFNKCALETRDVSALVVPTSTKMGKWLVHANDIVKDANKDIPNHNCGVFYTGCRGSFSNISVPKVTLNISDQRVIGTIEFNHEMNCDTGVFVEQVWVQDTGVGNSSRIVPFFEDLKCSNSSRFNFVLSTHAKGFVRPFIKSSKYGVWQGEPVAIPKPFGDDDDSAKLVQHLETIFVTDTEHKKDMADAFVNLHKELSTLYATEPTDALTQLASKESQRLIAFMREHPGIYHNASKRTNNSPFLKIMMADSIPLTPRELEDKVAKVRKDIDKGKVLNAFDTLAQNEFQKPIKSIILHAKNGHPEALVDLLETFASAKPAGPFVVEMLLAHSSQELMLIPPNATTALLRAAMKPENKALFNVMKESRNPTKLPKMPAAMKRCYKKYKRTLQLAKDGDVVRRTSFSKLAPEVTCTRLISHPQGANSTDLCETDHTQLFAIKRNAGDDLSHCLLMGNVSNKGLSTDCKAEASRRVCPTLRQTVDWAADNLTMLNSQVTSPLMRFVAAKVHEEVITPIFEKQSKYEKTAEWMIDSIIHTGLENGIKQLAIGAITADLNEARMSKNTMDIMDIIRKNPLLVHNLLNPLDDLPTGIVDAVKHAIGTAPGVYPADLRVAYAHLVSAIARKDTPNVEKYLKDSNVTQMLTANPYFRSKLLKNVFENMDQIQTAIVYQQLRLDASERETILKEGSVEETAITETFNDLILRGRTIAEMYQTFSIGAVAVKHFYKISNMEMTRQFWGAMSGRGTKMHRPTGFEWQNCRSATTESDNDQFDDKPLCALQYKAGFVQTNETDRWHRVPNKVFTVTNGMKEDQTMGVGEVPEAVYTVMERTEESSGNLTAVGKTRRCLLIHGLGGSSRQQFEARTAAFADIPRQLDDNGEYRYWGGMEHSTLLSKLDCQEVWVFLYPHVEGNSLRHKTLTETIVNMLDTFEYNACHPDQTRILAHSYASNVLASTCSDDLFRVLQDGTKGDCLYGPGKVNNKTCACPSWANIGGPLAGAPLVDLASQFTNLAARPSYGLQVVEVLDSIMEDSSIQITNRQGHSATRCSFPDMFDATTCKGDDMFAPSALSGVPFKNFAMAGMSIFANHNSDKQHAGALVKAARNYVEVSMCGVDSKGPYRNLDAYLMSIMPDVQKQMASMNGFGAKMGEISSFFNHRSKRNPALPGFNLSMHDGAVPFDSCAMTAVQDVKTAFSADWTKGHSYEASVNHLDLKGVNGDFCCGADLEAPDLWKNDFQNNPECKVCQVVSGSFWEDGTRKDGKCKTHADCGRGKGGVCAEEKHECVCHIGWRGKNCEYAPLWWVEDHHATAKEINIECSYMERKDTCPMRFLAKWSRSPAAPSSSWPDRDAWCKSTGGGKPLKCEVNNGGCPETAECIQDSGSRHTKCKCKDGYTGHGRTCVAIDRCKTNYCGSSGDCFGGCDTANNAICTMTGPAQNNCTCPKHLVAHGSPETEPDKPHKCRNNCSVNHGGCHVNATCDQNGLKDICKCNHGFQGDGKNCKDINPCTMNGGADSDCDKKHGVCNYIGNGMHNCSCAAGYAGMGNSTECKAVDRCASEPGDGENENPCAEHGVCTFKSPGQVQCICNAGYHGDGTGGSCVEPELGSDCTNDCSGHGHCDMFGTCQCAFGFEGDDCSLKKGAHGPCPGECSGHGDCMMKGKNKNDSHCVCEPQWRGAACDVVKGSALQFFGKQRVMIDEGLPDLQQFTILAWVKRFPGAHGMAQTMLTSSNIKVDGATWIGFHANSVNESTVTVSIAGNKPSHQQINFTPYADGHWHQLGITYHSRQRTLSVYVDRHLVESVRFDHAITAKLGAGKATVIGDLDVPVIGIGMGFRGVLDDVQVWQRAKPFKEMTTRTAVYKKNANLIAYYPMDENYDDTDNLNSRQIHDVAGRHLNGRLMTNDAQGFDGYAIFIPHPTASMAVRAGQVPKKAEVTGPPPVYAYGRLVGPPPVSFAPNKPYISRICDPATGKGCARCCKNADGDAAYTKGVPSLPFITYSDCVKGEGTWLCDGMNFCHQLNNHEACCVSTRGNNTCADMPESTQHNPDLRGSSLPDLMSVSEGVVNPDPAMHTPVKEMEDSCWGCGPHGTCDAATEKCMCEKGYAGKHCDMPSCNSETDLPCSGHGGCDTETNTCSCAPGWLGLACGTQFPVECSGRLKCTVDTCECQQASCMNNCNGNGKCGDDFRCQCYKDYSGLDCSYYVGCPSQCSGHGECKKGQDAKGSFYRGRTYHGKCQCTDMWTGMDCNVIDANQIGS